MIGGKSAELPWPSWVWVAQLVFVVEEKSNKEDVVVEEKSHPLLALVEPAASRFLM